MEMDYEFRDLTSVKVVIPRGNQHSGFFRGKGPMFDWCREYCTGRWCGACYNVYETEWIFANEQDAMLFSLRWL